jgi:putative flippase GtrA
MKIETKMLGAQFFRHAAVGLVCFAIEYILFLLMTYVMHVDYFIAALIAYIVATVLCFFGSMKWVFPGRTGQKRIHQAIIFTVLSIIGLGLNQLFIYICVDMIGMWAWVGKLIATFIVTIYNFFTRKYFFEDRDKPSDE